jgi:hypothetical protein
LLHELIAHAPVVQVALAFAREHEIPQPPQFVSVRVLVSQPLRRFESQVSNPARHLGSQALLTQLFDDVLTSWQTSPHPPQLFLSFVVSRHTPEQQVPLKHSDPAPHDSPLSLRHCDVFVLHR